MSSQASPQSSANIHFSHPGSSMAESQPSLPQVDQHNSIPTNESLSSNNIPYTVSRQPATLPSSTSTPGQATSTSFDVDQQQNSESDIERYLDRVKGINQADHKWIRRILELMDNIYKLPPGQRGNRLRDVVKCLGLNQQERDHALQVLGRRLGPNHEGAKDRYMITKWLILLFHHVQDKAMKARNSAKIAEKVEPEVAEQIQKMAPFCREGLHKLKCGHYRATHEECGMSCYGRSTFPDKPLTFDVRMSEIVCFKCPY
ncbi:hypothetical protein QM012_002425 [Aureobasidium pullulans]|uniref:VHS domain-containing protein n=1 Tax=Aureobasidium pullulans TaxID=5580 RepID=A0ABR0TBX3_AURPU